MQHHIHTFAPTAAAAAIGLHVLAGSAQETAPNGRAGDGWTYLRQDGTMYTEWIAEALPQACTVASGMARNRHDTALERTYDREGELQEPRRVKYESATRSRASGDFLERDGYQLAALHVPRAPAWSPLPDGAWSISMAAADGRTSASSLTVKDQRAVWQGVRPEIPGCQRLPAPVEFQRTADGALMHVMRSLASESCPDLHFQLTRTPEGTWRGTGVAAGSLAIEAAR